MRRARYQKKKRERRSYSSHKSQNHYTTFFIDSIAFAKENTNETYEAIKNWSLAAPKIASLATDTEKQTKNMINIRSRHFAKQRNKNSKQTENS